MKKIFTHLCLRPLFLLVALLCVGVGSVWGDTVLFSTNFSTADGWTTEDIITSTNTEATRTIKGTTISFKGYSSQNVSVSAGEGTSDGSFTFTKSYMSVSAGATSSSNPNYYMAIPITGVVEGTVTVKYTASSSVSLLYTYDDGNKGKIVSRSQSPSKTDGSFTISGLTSDEVTIYLGAYGLSITSLTITTYEKVDLASSTFYSFYQSSSSTAQSLKSAASLPSYIIMSSITGTEYSSSNSSYVTTPNDFSNLGNGTFYRLKASNGNTIVIGALSNVKSIRLYGNGSGYDGTISFTATKLSGSGEDISIESVNYENSKQEVIEFSTGDLTGKSEYDQDTYYFYTITFSKRTNNYLTNFSLWGLYIEAASTLPTVDAPTGLSCTTQTKSSLTYEWTAAANASSYDVTLYSDSECTDQVATDNVTTTSKTFTGLSGSTTYYCKVQSKGDGSTYAENGGVTDAASGTTAAKDYTLTVASNNDSYGTATAVATSLDASETTTITATANTGYKFRSWDVSGTDATLSSTTTNPTTLTMGTGDATVTANFSALETYTITYNKGEHGSGSTIANGEKTEDADFTLSSSKYTYSGHLQTGWALTDGGDKAYDLGGTYTGNADLDLYPYWTEQYTITYNANGGTRTMPTTTGAGDVTLRANYFLKTGYTFIGWATSQDNADAGIVAYLDQAAYTLTANVTLYAVWAETYCVITPATSGDAPTAGSTIILQDGDFGGSMKVTETTSSLSYVPNGFQSSWGTTTLRVEMNSIMKVGSVIVLTLYNGSTSGDRGYLLKTIGGTMVGNLTKYFASMETITLYYTITAGSALEGANTFLLEKAYNPSTTIKSLAVTDCQPGGVITDAGWSTYSSNKKLDLSTIIGGTAYVAVADEGSRVKMKPCTDIVAAETGLMIKGTAGDKFTINTTTSAPSLSMENLMVGLPNGGTVTAAAGNYVFGWPTASENPAEDCRFYYVNSSAATLGIGKAYLAVGNNNGARLSLFIDDDNTTTGITNAKGTTDANHNYFDLQGRKVAKPTKGLYIENGKKVVVK